ncbi:hypothetical protein ILUMI_13970 [Ignelater luminosus]|uniref:Uncharacterized protein n=1 Tax=Ignelater luminosus TaxID=2038154 RepID=A0A8K0G5A7_IGNLU|nr:hypothetical protein ILUMI_13970 [Ignelater luminosus]
MIHNNGYEQNLGLHMLFMNDSISRNELCEAMKSLGIPSKLMRLVKMTLTNTNNRIMREGSFSNPFQINRGFKAWKSPVSRPIQPRIG